MTKPERPPWHERSSWTGRTILRALLLGLAYVMCRGWWEMAKQFWNGVPFRTTTRMMGEQDWDSRFGISDFIGYALSVPLYGFFCVLAAGFALLSLSHHEADSMITSMKRTLTNRAKASEE